MAELSPELILYPVFAMFLLVAIVFVRLGRLRFRAVGSGEVPAGYYKTYDEGREPEHIRVVTRNLVNLFEMPVLFYVGVILAYVTNAVSYWMIGLAWAYVVVRYVHSYVHLTSNHVLTRFRIYLVSGLVLFAMWSILLVQLIGRH